MACIDNNHEDDMTATSSWYASIVRVVRLEAGAFHALSAVRDNNEREVSRVLSDLKTIYTHSPLSTYPRNMIKNYLSVFGQGSCKLEALLCCFNHRSWFQRRKRDLISLAV